MFFFLLVIVLFFCLDIWWLYRINAMLRRRGMQRWQWCVRLFVVAMMLGMIWIAIPIRYTGSQKALPAFIPALVYIWHVLVLPITALLLTIPLAMRAAVRTWRRLRDLRSQLSHRRDDTNVEPENRDSSALSRREFVRAAAVTLLPPTAATALAGISLGQIGHFVIQPYMLWPANWPGELDGYTITVIADVHVGPFTNEAMLGQIIRQTNALDSDLVLLGGDLINMSLAELPGALDMVRQLRARDGVFMVQGNHDIFDNAAKFNAMCFQRGVQLLLDDVATIYPAGGGPGFQLLGITYLKDQGDDFPTVIKVAGHPKRNASMFPVLLAHHPHAWDQARKLRLPLTISAHTHGGQIMLTDHIGGGPVRFRYWTGLHHDPANQSQLVISNGVGNWFPLRYRAPEQILHLTLHAT